MAARLWRLIHTVEFLWVTSDSLCNVLMVSHRIYVVIQICTIFNLKKCNSACNNLQYIVLLKAYLPRANSSTDCEILWDIVTATVFICYERRNCLNTMHHFIVMTSCLQRCIRCYIFLCSDCWKWVAGHVRTLAASHFKGTSVKSDWIQDTETDIVNIQYLCKTKRENEWVLPLILILRTRGVIQLLRLWIFCRMMVVD